MKTRQAKAKELKRLANPTQKRGPGRPRKHLPSTTRDNKKDAIDSKPNEPVPSTSNTKPKKSTEKRKNAETGKKRKAAAMEFKGLTTPTQKRRPGRPCKNPPSTTSENKNKRAINCQPNEPVPSTSKTRATKSAQKKKNAQTGKNDGKSDWGYSENVDFDMSFRFGRGSFSVVTPEHIAAAKAEEMVNLDSTMQQLGISIYPEATKISKESSHMF